MLQDILRHFCRITGFNQDAQRDLCLQYVNIAAKELYNQLEADSLMKEVVLIVPRDSQVSLPPYIGEVRGLREYGYYGYGMTVPINEIGVPRYSSDTQKFRWRNWTYKGKRALAVSITNSGPVTLTSVAVETPNIEIVITGRTEDSHRITETITLTATSVTGLKSFAAIDSITCLSGVRTYDITIMDLNGNELAILYNNEATTSYNIFDVSTYPWSNPIGNGTTTLIETLFKAKFYPFFNLTDEFVAPGYDDGIVYRALMVWYQGQEGKGVDAALYAKLAAQVIEANITNDERGQVLKIQQGSNPTYNIFRKLRNSWGYGWWTNNR